MRTIFQWLRWVCLLLLGLAWTTTPSFAAVGALNQANGGVTIRYDATQTQNRGYDAEPSRAWDNNPPEMVDASAFFGSPAQFLAANNVARLNYVPTSGAVLEGQAGRTSTILGSYQMDMKHIVSEMGNVKSLDFGAKPGGFNVLNVPDNLYKSPAQFWSQYNQPWLAGAVQRGDNVICHNA